jgi:hypothetical protein
MESRVATFGVFMGEIAGGLMAIAMGIAMFLFAFNNRLYLFMRSMQPE